MRGLIDLGKNMNWRSWVCWSVGEVATRCVWTHRDSLSSGTKGVGRGTSWVASNLQRGFVGRNDRQTGEGVFDVRIGSAPIIVREARLSVARDPPVRTRMPFGVFNGRSKIYEGREDGKRRGR